MATSSSDSLTSWVRTRLAALYEFPSEAQQAELQSSFDASFSPQAQILVNHAPVARDAFKDDLSRRAIAAARASVDWKELIEVPKADDADEAEIVAGCFVVTRSMKFRIRAAPAQTHSTVIFSAKIDRDPNIHEGDPRHIVHLVQTVADKAAPIHMQGVAQS
ncbi:hypothetical protein LshimejAT787_0209410 [Lyophyllum shimeji]|uniref:Uncharacterized protein n=1 Tax=Lyophyllum shimeji TaxID=47721 RepID=A0A9P3PGF1_LYOSH|nr:hypothetical protein LshimejAT787_0209410 [Lyophyllum shimeji]